MFQSSLASLDIERANAILNENKEYHSEGELTTEFDVARALTMDKIQVESKSEEQEVEHPSQTEEQELD